MYHFTLLAQLKINRLALFVVEDIWECKVCFGTQQGFAAFSLPPAIQQLHEITPLSHLTVDRKWREFETVIPVIQDKKVLAYVLIGNVHPFYSDRGALSF